jgi:hypothetical protein
MVQRTFPYLRDFTHLTVRRGSLCGNGDGGHWSEALIARIVALSEVKNMSNAKFFDVNQDFEIDKVVMLERLRRDTNNLSQQLIESGLKSDVSKRVALALAGNLDKSALDANEQRFLRQVELFA